MREKMGDKQRLEHISESIAEIISYLDGNDYKSFSANSNSILSNTAVIRECGYLY